MPYSLDLESGCEDKKDFSNFSYVLFYLISGTVCIHQVSLHTDPQAELCAIFFPYIISEHLLT